MNDLEEEEYTGIRGRLSKTEDTHLLYDSHDSDETCGARWTHQNPSAAEYPHSSSGPRKRKLSASPQSASSSSVKMSSSSSYPRKKISSLHRGRGGGGYLSRKLPRVSAIASGQLSTRSNASSSVTNTIHSLPSLSLIATASHSHTQSNEGEDGYDGASERGRCEQEEEDAGEDDDDIDYEEGGEEEEEEASKRRRIRRQRDEGDRSYPSSSSYNRGMVYTTVSPDGSEKKESSSSVGSQLSFSPQDPLFSLPSQTSELSWSTSMRLRHQANKSKKYDPMT